MATGMRSFEVTEPPTSAELWRAMVALLGKTSGRHTVVVGVHEIDADIPVFPSTDEITFNTVQVHFSEDSTTVIGATIDEDTVNLKLDTAHGANPALLTVVTRY